MTERPDFVRLRKDEWWDEIRLIAERSESPVLRLATFYRYKTSGLSGDEWRTSVMWQTTLPLADSRPPTDGWRDLDGPYHRLEDGCAAIYPGIYRSHPGIHDLSIARIDFMRKALVLYTSTYEGDARPLLVICGHLPWALATAESRMVSGEDHSLCFQPGCAEKAVSTYRLKHRYCRDGHKHEATHTWPSGPVYDARRFCLKHLRRGDCGLEDADANYIVVDGPGPDQAQGWQKHESESVFGGIVDLREKT